MINLNDLLDRVSQLSVELHKEATEAYDHAVEAKDQADDAGLAALKIKELASKVDVIAREIKDPFGDHNKPGPVEPCGPEEAQGQGFAVHRAGGFNDHYCVELPQLIGGQDWPVVTIKAGDLRITVALLPAAKHHKDPWKPGDGWRGADVKLHGTHRVSVLSTNTGMRSEHGPQNVDVRGPIGQVALLKEDL